MAVVKSDAMVMHEKWIEEVASHRPKRTNDKVMHIEVRNYIIGAAAILVVIVAAISLMH